MKRYTQNPMTRQNGFWKEYGFYWSWERVHIRAYQS